MKVSGNAYIDIHVHVLRVSILFLLDLGLFLQCGINYTLALPEGGVYCFTSVRPPFRPS